MSKLDEPAIGVPFYVGQNPYQAGAVPTNAIYSDPKGIPIQQTIFRDTPAPFNCVYCGNTGMTTVSCFDLFVGAALHSFATICVDSNKWSRCPPFLGLSKPSLAAVVGCTMPMMLGVCFLCPSMDCLWHKYHYCSSCKEKVGDFEKSDPCAVMDPPHWTQESFALPA